MGLFSGLFWGAKRRVQQMTKDNDMGTFREKLNELVAQKDTLSDDDIAAKVEELKGIITDLPEGEDKSKLGRFLEDFKSVKEQDAQVAEKAAGSVADLFEKLDTEAMKDAPAEEPVEEETVSETETGDEDAAEVEKKTEEETVKETDAAENEEDKKDDETSDEDPNPQYTLEEIYQFIKKRLAEESADTDETVEDEDSKEDEGTEDECADDEEEKKPVTTDCAPTIPVTVNHRAAQKGGLADMFAAIKNGGIR